jgi:hypothetical protein
MLIALTSNILIVLFMGIAAETMSGFATHPRVLVGLSRGIAK